MSLEDCIPAIAASGYTWRPTKPANTLLGWWEARSDLVTQSGGLASQVNNRKSGGGDPLVQASAGAKPAVETTAWGGGRVSLLFDGVDDVMTANGIASAVSGTDQPWTVVMVAQIVTLGSVIVARSVFGFGNSGDSNPSHDLRLPASTTNVLQSARRDNGAVTTKLKNAAATITTARATYSLVFNGTAVALWINSVLDANLDGSVAASADNDTGAATLTTFTVGGLSRVTTDFQSSLRLGGMLAYTGALSNGDRLKAENYLKLMHPL